MIGICCLCANSNGWSSTAFRPGICKSVIKQDVLFTCDDRRNSSAELNAQASNPSDLTRLLREERTDSSSSMIEMIGAFCNCLSSPQSHGGECRTPAPCRPP